jgi:hypothetical protein
VRAQRLALHKGEKAARETHLGAFNSAYERASRPKFLVQSILEIRMGSTNLLDLCSSPPFKIALVPPRKAEKVILARVVWLELLRTDHGVTEEGRPSNQMSHENEMIGWITQE